LFIHQLCDKAVCNRTKICDGVDICVEICEPGSVKVDPWLKNAFKTQRKLLDNQMINYVYLPGTHNSAITKAYGYGLEEDYLSALIQTIDPTSVVYIANQQMSIYDQLNFGIRHLELDIHWFEGEIRMCHAGGIELDYLNDLIAFLSEIFDIPIEWDSETIGCFFPNYRTLNQTFEEIQSWFLLPENNDEILIFMFDDQEDLLEWGKVQYILEGLSKYFANLILTPPEKQKYWPDRWPTVKEMSDMGKHLIFTSRTDYGKSMEPYIFFRDAIWREYSPDTFKNFPICMIQDGFPSNNGNISRVLGDSLIYGPFYNGSTEGLFVPSNLLSMAECNVNFPCVDQGSPLLVQGAIWTWDINEPSQNGTVCVAQYPNGRWKTISCNTSLSFACQNSKVTNSWKVTSIKGPWNSSNVCKEYPGYQFSVPTNGYLNSILRNVGSGQPIWINYNSSV